MKIKIEEALKIYNKYDNEDIPLIYLSDIHFVLDNNAEVISRGSRFTPSHFEMLQKASIKEVPVIFNDRLCAKLVANYPADYKLPINKKNTIEMDRLIDTLETSNTGTKRKRSIISLSEVYKKNADDTYEPILNYGERLHYKRWNDVKVNLNRNTLIDYRYDEGGIIVFFLLNASDPFYAQKFMKFTDLVSMIVESKSAGINISPDFNPELDVYTVNDKVKLLEVYSDSRATLIIIGEDLNDDYKRSLNQVKSYDKFVKMMVIKNPDPKQRSSILNSVKNIYGQKLWEE